MAVALITGGGAGIGAAFADRLASRGYDLLLVAGDPDRLHATARAVAERHAVRADVLVADVATRRGAFRVAALLSGIEAPAVDVLVNDTAGETAERFARGPAGARRTGTDPCVTATTRITHAVLPGMVRRGTGAIVNVGATAGHGPAAAWVTAFTDSLGPTLAGTGVRALAVCPGAVDTAWNVDGRSSGAAGRVLRVDAGRVADTALADLDAGRAVSDPGPAPGPRPLIAALELPRRALRTVGTGARMARRGAELLADATRQPLMPVPARRDAAEAPRLPDSPTRPDAGRAVAAAGGCGRSEHFLAGGPRTAQQRARAAAAARDRARSDRRARGTVDRHPA
ncbi:SDR family NAD(P)-dependent oxidoreductase [Pseudonocardia nantongensis]|uniref:SDR family NAD(P)-dependent oxidoreductase n=1 Tax=Pseudonocardia nantongensis TaxID=1181885 RepID=UPI00397D406C